MAAVIRNLLRNLKGYVCFWMRMRLQWRYRVGHGGGSATRNRINLLSFPEFGTTPAIYFAFSDLIFQDQLAQLA